MTQADYRRHDISDRAFEKIAPVLPGGEGKVGRSAVDNRLFIKAVMWVLRTGAPWRDLPPEYGHWKNVHRRFCRWRDRGVWAMLLDIFIEDADFEWLLVDSSYRKVHPQACGAEGGNQAMSRSKGGLNTKVHVAVDAHGLPVRAVVTDATTADAQVIEKLIEDLPATAVLADKAYDVNHGIEHRAAQGIVAVIPPKKTVKSCEPMTNTSTKSVT